MTGRVIYFALMTSLADDRTVRVICLNKWVATESVASPEWRHVPPDSILELATTRTKLVSLK